MEIKLKTLVVDDSSVMRLMVIQALKRIQGIDWNFIEASNGVDALTAFALQPIDIGFVDWKMPQMDGVEVIQQLRLLDGKTTPLIMVTSEKTVAKIQQTLRESSADGYICKPFTPEDVASKVCPIITELLNRKARSRSFFARLLG
jgi:two-component system chemotaxis response regulator CheY